jgi:hypothetical protein
MENAFIGMINILLVSDDKWILYIYMVDYNYMEIEVYFWMSCGV